MYNVSIPKITDEELLARYAKIKPIVKVGIEKYFLREFTLEELKTRAYTWETEQTKAGIVNMDEFVDINEDFECIHTYGYHGFFKPTIAEVLAQIKDTDVGVVDAFEIIESPETAESLSRNKNAFNQGFHTSTVRLYNRINNN